MKTISASSRSHFLCQGTVDEPQRLSVFSQFCISSHACIVDYEVDQILPIVYADYVSFVLPYVHVEVFNRLKLLVNMPGNDDMHGGRLFLQDDFFILKFVRTPIKHPAQLTVFKIGYGRHGILGFMFISQSAHQVPDSHEETAVLSFIIPFLEENGLERRLDESRIHEVQRTIRFRDDHVETMHGSQFFPLG